MTKISTYILALSCVLCSLDIFAQGTTSSPYSQYGIGILNGSQLTECRSLGGLSAGYRKLSPYNSINLANPASYSAIRMTTFDIGLTGGNTNLTKGEVTENSFDAALNHLVFAMPVTKNSALSFGLVPYSSKGYNFTDGDVVAGNPVNYLYSADGGISKAYLGYGFKLAPRLSVGANASYLFGKISESKASEYADASILSSRTQSNDFVSGLTFDYGLQYEAPVNKRVTLIVGYAGSSNSTIKSKAEVLTTRYFKDVASGANSVAIDTTEFLQDEETNIKLPLTQTLGFVLQRSNRWLVGADLRMGLWKNYKEGNTASNFQNSMGVSVGTQFVPDFTSVGSYFKVVDYRIGLRYDKTHLKLRDQNINEAAFSFGLGLPLPANRSTFYKINLGTEIGQRGTTKSGLVRERFVNVFLSFTINDQWFQKYKFD